MHFPPRGLGCCVTGAPPRPDRRPPESWCAGFQSTDFSSTQRGALTTPPFTATNIQWILVAKCGRRSKLNFHGHGWAKCWTPAIKAVTLSNTWRCSEEKAPKIQREEERTLPTSSYTARSTLTPNPTKTSQGKTSRDQRGYRCRIAQVNTSKSNPAAYKKDQVGFIPGCNIDLPYENELMEYAILIEQNTKPHDPLNRHRKNSQ